MSWLTRTIAATLSSPRGEPDDYESETSSAADRATADEGSSSPRGPVGVEPEQPNTPTRGVKDDISELTETLTRRLWGVASFLAPPPPPPESSSPRAAEEAEGSDGQDGGEEEDPQFAGIRSDLAEIGGRVRSGISMLQNNMAVAEISKIASSLLPFGEEAADDGADAVPGVTEEVLVFVRHISTRPETWLDFPLFISERYADDFELSDAQYPHALAMEHLVPSLSNLKVQICSTDMSEACFWKIYFVLLHSKLSKQDAELLSTSQILEAREELLQSLQAKNKRGSVVTGESSENVNVSSAPVEEKVVQPSSIQDKVAISEELSFEEPTSDVPPEIEAEKFQISTTTEVEIIDKSVIEEELLVKDESKTSLAESKIHVETDEDEVDEWPDDDTTEEPEAAGTAANRTSLGQEEDVSFSDLEDDDDDDNKGLGK